LSGVKQAPLYSVEKGSQIYNEGEMSKPKYEKKTDEQLKECKERQVKVCKEKNWPHFAPTSGVCWRCHRNIYQNYDDSGLGEDGSKPIIGCPHCNRSYCD
jgi:hypothetical protein